jgi:precorrin-2/cobalt-factor-2 C20-methyltransferase
MTTGKLYGIGVGPGDPKLLTVKAKETLERSAVIAYPIKKEGEDSVALEIVRKEVDISGKDVVALLFKMDPSEEVRGRCRAAALDRICAMLDEGKDVSMITLGDVSVYSTYMRINDEIAKRGYDTEIIPGIPSFCSGAAKAKLPLMIGNEGLAVVPSAEENRLIGEALDEFDNIVVMKAFNSIGKLASMMSDRGIPLSCATVISCVGMEDEYIGPMDTGRSYGYFTTVLIKKRRE